jgi:hypothetical protein
MDSDLYQDAIKMGIANLLFVKVIQKVFPNNIPAQIFISGFVFHIVSEYLKTDLL